MRRPRLLLHGSLVSRRLALRRRLYRRLAFHRLLCRGLMRRRRLVFRRVTLLSRVPPPLIGGAHAPGYLREELRHNARLRNMPRRGVSRPAALDDDVARRHL